MKPIQLHDKDRIEAFFRRNILLHIYSIGDLDDYFWPYTTWYALEETDGIRQIALLYTGLTMPTLLAITDDRIDEMREFIASMVKLLPGRFYSHLSEGLSDVLRGYYTVDIHGNHYKMGLTDRSRCDGVDTSGVFALRTSDKDDLDDLYRASYPGHWFESQMLETGHYYGIREGGRLVSVAGVHVYSNTYKVAALGNIATHPDRRGEGLATKATAKLCQELLRTVEHIGLNVKTDNDSAITCYRNLGFEPIATYEECMLEKL
jgi:GNAT superfamily N-acetyltransferase